VFLIAAFVLLVFVPSPWNLVAFGISLALFVGELTFWHRKVRGKPKQVGAHTLIGEKATVISACRPLGQVRVGGEIWAARCEDGADPPEAVTVVGRDGLTLTVERIAPSGP
jgi:membrane protein implicated in regulation of membrane protease activity